MKKKLIVSAVSIIMLVSLMVSATFALFTSSVNLANNSVKAGKVDFAAKLDFKSAESSLGNTGNTDITTGGKTGVMLGGLREVSVKDNKQIIMDNIVPGDQGVFTLSFTNNSTVATKFKVAIVPSEKDISLLNALTCTNETVVDAGKEADVLFTKAANNKEISLTSQSNIGNLAWIDLAKGEVPIAQDISIKFNQGSGNEFQSASFSFDIFVFAVQANGANSVLFATSVADINKAKAGETVVLASDIIIDENIVITTTANIDLAGHTIKGKTVSFGDPDYAKTIMFENGTVAATKESGISITYNYPLATGTFKNLVNQVAGTASESVATIFAQFSSNTLNIGENVKNQVIISGQVQDAAATIIVGSGTTVRVQDNLNTVNLTAEAEATNVKIVDERVKAEDQTALPTMTIVIPDTATVAVERPTENKNEVVIDGNAAVSTPNADQNGAWDGESSSLNWYDSSKSEYSLSSAADLAGLAFLVNNKNNFEGKEIKLANNIDLLDKAWMQIGNAATSFRGTFDGNGKKISGLTNALFAGLAQDSVVKNLTLNVNINKELLTENFGALALKADGATIQKVSIAGNIAIEDVASSVDKAAGLIGDFSNSKMADCTSEIKITVTKTADTAILVSGMVAFMGNYSCIQNCSFSGEISATSNVIVYYNKDIYGNDKLNDPNQTQALSVGGIVGMAWAQIENKAERFKVAGSIIGCSASGKIKVDAPNGYGYAAGIVAQNIGVYYCSVDGKNYPTLRVEKNIAKKITLNVEAKNAKAAGIATYMWHQAYVGHCVAQDITIDIKGTNDAVAGGIVAYAELNSNILFCYSTGCVITAAKTNGDAYAGGIVGASWGPTSGNLYISNCFALKNTLTANFAGEIAGSASNQSNYEKCYFAGSNSGFGADGANELDITKEAEDFFKTAANFAEGNSNFSSWYGMSWSSEWILRDGSLPELK